MIFHPATLELLAAHKRSGASAPPLALLALLTDNTAFIGLDMLFEILFSHTGRGDPAAVQQQLTAHARAVVCDDGLRCLWPRLPSSARSLLAAARSSPPHAIGAPPASNLVEALARADDCEGPEICDEPGLNTVNNPTPRKRKKEAVRQVGTLPFESTGRSSVTEIGKFAPLEPKNASFVYSRSKVILDTQRKRDDLIAPRKLQFIHHFDQRRPPIYRIRPTIVPSVHSFRPILPAASYDLCSSDEWDEALETQSSSAASESDESSGKTNSDCVVPDSDAEAPVEATRYAKKPTFVYENATVQVFFEDGRFKDAFLEESDAVPETLLPTLKALYTSETDLQLISQLYGVKLSVLQNVL